MHIQFLSRRDYIRTMVLGFVASIAIVTAASFLARATLNLKAAISGIDKPDISVLLLMGEKEVESATLLRDQKTSRDYLVETTNGPKLVTIKKGEKTWYLAEQEDLRAE